MQRKVEFGQTTGANQSGSFEPTGQYLSQGSDQKGILPKRPMADLADRFEAWLVRFENLQYQPIFGIAFVACVTLVLVTWWFLSPGEPTAVEDKIDYASEASASDQVANPAEVTGGSVPLVETENVTADGPQSTVSNPEAAPITDSVPSTEELVIHVVGAVQRPGLVTVKTTERVADAIKAAGGFSLNADSELLNLASPLQDGVQILVPAIGDDITLPLIRPSEHSSPLYPDLSAGTVAVINVNTASVQELMSLPGVGPSIAAAIVAWRSENGSFLSVDDLESVPGIGPAKLAGLMEQAVV